MLEPFITVTEGHEPFNVTAVQATLTLLDNEVIMAVIDHQSAYIFNRHHQSIWSSRGDCIPAAQAVISPHSPSSLLSYHL